VVALHEIGESVLEDRAHGITDDVFPGLGRFRRPVLPLGAREQVAGVRKGRDPPAILETRIPADVIHVHVRAEHAIDRLGGIAGLGKLLEERPLEPVPERDPPHTRRMRTSPTCHSWAFALGMGVSFRRWLGPS
jgi:hypothetical protein